jgi:hypothetical protein
MVPQVFCFQCANFSHFSNVFSLHSVTVSDSCADYGVRFSDGAHPSRSPVAWSSSHRITSKKMTCVMRPCSQNSAKRGEIVSL